MVTSEVFPPEALIASGHSPLDPSALFKSLHKEAAMRYTSFCSLDARSISFTSKRPKSSKLAAVSATTPKIMTTRINSINVKAFIVRPAVPFFLRRSFSLTGAMRIPGSKPVIPPSYSFLIIENRSQTASLLKALIPAGTIRESLH
jgi:hypothetical protein